MVKRPKYKALYLNAEERRKEWQEECEELRLRIDRADEALEEAKRIEAVTFHTSKSLMAEIMGRSNPSDADANEECHF